MIHTVSASVDVDAPIATVYNQWTQFEDFPLFMSTIERIDQLTDVKMRWVVNLHGVRREFDATIVDQVADDHISWESLDQELHSGTVRFNPTPSGGTRVSLELSWFPESFAERVGAGLDFDDRAAAKDLARFKGFIERHGHKTGAWRGEVHAAHSERPERGGPLEPDTDI